MSLRIWLPLKGNLDNLGLDQVEVVNNGATIDNSGKIGQCYYFNGSSYINVVGLDINNSWSYGCWFKEEASSRTWGGMIILNNNGGDTDIQFGFYTYPTGSKFQTTANGQYNSSVAHTFDNKWHHLFATFDGSSLKTYRDGILINTKSITASLLKRSNLTLGARRRTSSYDCYWKGYMNDFRVYDHCLSLKEIEELSKCLILHYKLDKPNISLVSGAAAGRSIVTNTNNSTYLTGVWGNGSGGNGSVTAIEDLTAPVGRYSYRISNNTSGNKDVAQYGPYPYFSLTEGQQYTMSCWYKGKTTIRMRIWDKTTGSERAVKTQAIDTGDEWQLITNTFTATAAMNTNNIGFLFGLSGSSNGNVYICGMKVELGSSYTGFVGSLEDEPEFNTVIDSSGYGNNATSTNVFSITDSSKYNISVKSLNARIIHDGALAPGTEGFTFSIWVKRVSRNAKGKILDIEIGNKKFNFGETGDATYDQFMVFSFGTNATYWAGNNFIIPLNEWHHWAGTFDGTKNCLYKDGNLVFQSSTTKTYTIESTETCSVLNIANLLTDVYVNDCRIYATVLTATQIKELYDTSMGIDSNGNVYAREVIE